MAKARNVGKNLDAVFSVPKSVPNATTNIEPVAPPTIVNATGLTEDVPVIPIAADQEAPKSAYHVDSFRESIYDKRNKQIASESGIPDAPAPPEATEDEALAPSAPATEVIPPASEPEVPGTVAVTDEPQVASTPEIIPPQKYPVIVNGQRIEYTLEELQQQAQLGVAARQNFEEAARLRKEAEAMVSSRQNSQPQPAVNNNTPSQLSDIPEAELLDIAKRMNYGSEAEQVDALRKAISLGMQQGRANTGPTPEQLVNVATQNALAVMTVQQENTIIFNEFQDVLKEPALAAAADFMAGQLHQKYVALGQNKSRLDLMREAGNEIRTKFVKPAVATPAIEPKPSAAVVKQDPNKVERKRAAPQTPTSASTVAKTSADDVSTANPEMVALAMRKNAMAEIQKARGQNVI